MTTMLTIKILFTINSLKKEEEEEKEEKKKSNLFIQSTIDNSCRFKKHLI